MSRIRQPSSPNVKNHHHHHRVHHHHGSSSRLAPNERRLIIRSVAALLGIGTLLWLFIVWSSLYSIADPVLYGNLCDGYQKYKTQRFIIFNRPLGQGTGNIMQGLLAAHMMGIEFDRVVCVNPNYKSFHAAFQAIHPDTATSCSALFECEKPLIGNADEGSVIRLLNFYPPRNECKLQETLASSQRRLIWLEANTYPRWRSVPDNLFLKFYQPKPALLEIIPWSTPPRYVVHLRAPDSTGDIRKGLDDSTLEALGKSLPSGEAYLVTNKVMWYDWFAQRYGWLHPPWQGVSHSAQSIYWGDRTGDWDPKVLKERNREDVQAILDLQMWADWVTLLRATSVIHTHSDFSSSAVHWMNTKDSHVLDDTLKSESQQQGTLRLLPEPWRQHDPVLPLVQRKEDQYLPENQQLLHCDQTTPLSGFGALRKDFPVRRIDARNPYNHRVGARAK